MKHPTMDEYSGGGSILNEWTSIKNVLSQCELHGLSPESTEEVWRIVKSGGECIILDGQIMAADEGPAP